MTINVSARSLVPTILNLGSGKDFRAECFNIDIDDSWFPDAIVDLGAVDLRDQSVVLTTRRFGEVELRPGSFDRIVANDVLEHVPNLMRLMTNCLALLKQGGVFEISVPYDLSCGAWQDPTHVRAFNERSWLYYTDWFWYMGWADWRFTLDTLQFVPSDIGTQLQSTMPLGELIRMPRAVDSMSVTLRKIPLGHEDRKVWEHWRERKRLAEQQRGTLDRSDHDVFGSNRSKDRNVIDLTNLEHDVTRTPAPTFRRPAPAGGHDLTLPTRPPRATSLEAFADGWTALADRHCIWIVSPEGYVHARTFDECADTLSEAFTELGGSAPVVRDPRDWNGRLPIVLGAHLLQADVLLPEGSILINFEQVSTGEGWIGETYLALLRRFPVLDYSIRNRAALVARGIDHAGLIGIGFSEGLRRIATPAMKDIDVLFYGSMNPRRKRILDELKARGLNVVTLFGAYGAERDAAIARAKIVLNLHFYESAIFEVVRVSYLLANGVCVLCEGDEDDADVAPFRGGLALCGYDDLVERGVALVADQYERKTLADAGLARMMERRQSALLKAVMPV